MRLERASKTGPIWGRCVVPLTDNTRLVRQLELWQDFGSYLLTILPLLCPRMPCEGLVAIVTLACITYRLYSAWLFFALFAGKTRYSYSRTISGKYKNALGVGVVVGVGVAVLVGVGGGVLVAVGVGVLVLVGVAVAVTVGVEVGMLHSTTKQAAAPLPASLALHT